MRLVKNPNIAKERSKISVAQTTNVLSMLFQRTGVKLCKSPTTCSSANSKL